MNIIKKTLSFLLSGALALTASIGSVTNAVADYSFSNSKNAIISNNKNEPYMPTFTLSRYNKSESSKYNYNVAVYDLYAKVDTEAFTKPDYEKISYESSHKITNVDFKLDNGDGSFIIPEIIGFESAQLCHYQVHFPKNGDYDCGVNASTGINGTYTIHVTGVNNFIDTSDQTLPKLSISYIRPTSYSDIPVTINVYSNELCIMTVDGKTYKECNKVEFPVYSNGQYPVSATDRNGNTKSSKFIIDFIPVEKPPETTKVPATTTTTSTTKITTTATTSTVTTTSTTSTTTATPTTSTVTTTLTTSTTTATPTTSTVTTTLTTSTTTTTTTTSTATTTTTKPQVTTTPINVNFLSGDANMDGRISIADATAILQSLGNPDKYKLSISGAINADCYKPGSGVTANDALAIRMLDAQMIDSLPILS